MAMVVYFLFLTDLMLICICVGIIPGYKTIKIGTPACRIGGVLWILVGLGLVILYNIPLLNGIWELSGIALVCSYMYLFLVPIIIECYDDNFFDGFNDGF